MGIALRWKPSGPPSLGFSLSPSISAPGVFEASVMKGDQPDQLAHGDRCSR